MEKIWPGLLGLLTLLLLVSGAFSPGWLVLDLGNIDGLGNQSTSTTYICHLGLFYILIVGDGFSEASSYSGVSSLSGSSYFTIGKLEYQIEVCVGIILVFISLIMTCAYNKDRAPSLLLAPIIMYPIACVVTLVAVGRFLRTVIIVASANGLSGFPYSLILSGLGGLFCFVLMILLILLKNQHRTANRPPQQGVIFTDISMATVGYLHNTTYGQLQGIQYGNNIYSHPQQGSNIYSVPQHVNSLYNGQQHGSNIYSEPHIVSRTPSCPQQGSNKYSEPKPKV